MIMRIEIQNLIDAGFTIRSLSDMGGTNNYKLRCKTLDDDVVKKIHKTILDKLVSIRKEHPQTIFTELCGIGVKKSYLYGRVMGLTFHKTNDRTSKNAWRFDDWVKLTDFIDGLIKKLK